MNHSMQRPGADLEKVVVRSLRKLPAGQAPLLAWPLACGSAVGVRTRALQFAQGILRVEVPDDGWRKELQALAPRYLAALNRYVAERVTQVEFVVGRGKTGPDGINGTKRF